MRPTEFLWQDLRSALRVLGKSRGATALSVLSIALGIGLTTGTFSIADALLLRPFPLERPSEVLYATSRGDDGREVPYGWPDYEDMVQAGRGLVELAAYQRRSTMLATGEDSENTLTHAVTPNYFRFLGVKAALGRASVEEREGRPAAVLGYRLWQRRFGGDPQIAGKTVLLDQKAFFVAGVMPVEFTGLMRGVATDIWVSTEAWFEVLGRRFERQERDGQFEIVARLKPGMNAERAGAQLDAAIRGPGKHKLLAAGVTGTLLEATFAPGWRDNLITGGGMLLMLGLALFVACANVAQLRLAQAESRKREIVVRMALGAGARRLTCQLLVETGVVSVAGVGLGMLLAWFLMGKASEFLAAGSVHMDYGIRLDYRVLAFTLAAGLLSVLLAGLAPARHAVRLDLAEALKSQQGATGARAGWQKKVLIVGQLAVTVALFGAATLFLVSLRNAMAVRPGFDPEKRLLVLRVGPGRQSQTVMWCEQACERLSGLPGVRGATFARRLPLSGSGGGATVRVEIPGQAPLGVYFNNVGGNYFSLMGTRVVAGRGIDTNDRQGSPPAIVVSQAFARRMFAERNPVGEWIRVAGQLRQVVGVAEDGPSNDLHEVPEPYLYFPFAQMPSGDITVIVETAGDPAALAQAVRQELKRFDTRVTLYSMTTLRRHMDRALSGDRMMAALAAGLGVFGLLLTAGGLFGVIQYTVSRRTRELGLRAALGAPPAAIRQMVLAESARLAAWGIPIGLVLLAAAARYFRSMVLGVSPLDPLIYLASAAAAMAVALAAAWLPAHRAARVAPMTALRYE
jgi:predicted permease